TDTLYVLDMSIKVLESTEKIYDLVSYCGMYCFFFFKQKTAYEIGLGIPAEPLFRSIKMIGVSNLQSFIASMTQKLTLSDISDESKNYLDKAGITTACLRIKSKWTAGGK